MPSFNKFQPFVANLGNKVFNLDSDTLKIALTNSAPVNTYNQLSQVTQIANGNGYTTGGATVPNNAYSQSGGVGTLVGDAVTFTASGGAMATFRYAVLYDDTATNDELIGWWDYGSAVSLANAGDSLTVKPDDEDTGGTILTVE